jgi:hypothetical protein
MMRRAAISEEWAANQTTIANDFGGDGHATVMTVPKT